MTIYSYCRTSELEDAMEKDELDGILEPELLSMQTYCLGRSWYMTESIRDSHCNWNQEFVKRENGKQLFQALQAGDIVLCSKLERIVSSSQEAVKLIRQLRDRRVQLHIVELNGDVTDQDLTVNFTRVAALFSALEKRKSAERIKGVKQRTG